MKTTLLILASLLLTGTLSAQLDPTAGHRYGIKSAIIKKETKSMAGAIANTLYFDNFGDREATEMTMKMGEEEKHLRVVAEDGGRMNVTLDLDEKKAFRMPAPDQPHNFRQLSPEDIERFKIKEVGTGDVAGKSCKKYEMELTQSGVKLQATVWSWEGIMLRYEARYQGNLMVTDEASEVEENVAVPADKFAIPAEVKVEAAPSMN